MNLGLGDVLGGQLAGQTSVTGHNGFVDGSVFFHGFLVPLSILHGLTAVAPGLAQQGAQGIINHGAAGQAADGISYNLITW